MAGIRQTIDKDGNPHPKWRFWFIDWQGKRVWKTGTEDPERTQAVADSFEARDAALRKQIELGLAEPPTSADLAKPVPIADIITEYLAWGNAQGGKGGRAWGGGHARMQKSRLKFWCDRLGLKTISDLSGILRRVERELRELHCIPKVPKDPQKKKAPTPATGKTKENYAGALSSFCGWARQRGYIASDPLDGRVPFDITPATQRRAMTADEIHKLLNSSAPHRRLLYEVAFCTGLRANELRQLTPAHVDATLGGLRLEATWTKARKPGFQPLPKELVARLQESAKAGTAKARYANVAWKGQRKSGTLPQFTFPADPLLYVPSHPARDLEKDLIAAGMTKWGPDGKVDFHAARVAYTTFIFEAGATLKEAQTMARHSDPNQTANTYGRARKGRLDDLAQAVGDVVLQRPICATDVQQKAVGAESDVISQDTNGLRVSEKWRRRESNPRPKMLPIGLLRV